MSRVKLEPDASSSAPLTAARPGNTVAGLDNAGVREPDQPDLLISRSQRTPRLANQEPQPTANLMTAVNNALTRFDGAARNQTEKCMTQNYPAGTWSFLSAPLLEMLAFLPEPVFLPTIVRYALPSISGRHGCGNMN